MRRSVLVLAALSLSAACGRGAPPAPREDRRQTFEGLTLSQSAQGRPTWTLHAVKALMFEDAKTADLEAPAMDFYREGRAVSHVKARTGTVQTETHDVRLSSSVVLDSFADHSRLTTDVLLYSSKTGRFHTEDEVTVTRPEGVIHGRGMDATPDLSEIRIFRQNSVLSGKSQAPE